VKRESAGYGRKRKGSRSVGREAAAVPSEWLRHRRRRRHRRRADCERGQGKGELQETGGFVRACLQLGSRTAATEAAAMGVDSSGNVRRKV
jgi:hypothetical protein